MHYKLRSSHFIWLVEHVKGGGILEGYKNVPHDVYRDLYLESQHQAEKGSRKANNLPETGAPCHLININVLPAQVLHASVVTTSLFGPLPLMSIL
jgi:hypothetical protein